MKVLFIVIALLLSAATLLHAQSKGAAGGGGGAGSQGSANQSTPQQGFVYFLKRNKHLHYASVRTETYYFTYKQLTTGKVARASIFMKPVFHDRKYTVSINLARWPLDDPKSGKIDFAEETIRPIKLIETDFDWRSHHLVADSVDTVLDVKVQYFDSIPRYWATKKDNWLLHDRLQIAITQDSALLMTRVYQNNFNSDARRNVAFVTNPNYNGIGPKDKRQTYLRAPKNPQKRPISEIEKDDFLPAVKVFDTARSDSSKLIAYEEMLDIYKGKLEPAYGYDKDDMAKASTEGVSCRKMKALKKILDSEFFVLDRDLDTVVDAYNVVFKKIKGELTALHDSLLNPGLSDDQRLESQLSYLDKLYAYQDKQPHGGGPGNTGLFPGPIAVQPTDEQMPETAIPINGEDSATDLYFRIIHKTLMRQSIYFLPYHYATWDYGTLTVPYRYRLPPKNKYIFTTTGKDSTAPAPSASDASISLSLYFGRKWGRTRYYEDPSMSHNTLSSEVAVITGPTLVTLSASNVDTLSTFTGKKKGYIYSGPSSIVAWSFGLGGMVQIRTINIGAFAGFDIPLSANTGWVYARHLWVGFGIGVNLGMLTSGHSVN